MKPYILLHDSISRSLVTASLLVIAVCGENGLAYERYKDPSTSSGNCAACHGDFTGATSPKGTVFPSDSKHEMHRASANMATACNLCHTSGDNRNPFLGSSTGTANNDGLGCSGCHVGAGLRSHHVASGITLCLDCHQEETPLPENVKPPYYGTLDTRADNPCNPVAVAQTNENWSIGDFLGLDNDGNNLYDVADFACGPYQIVKLSLESTNVRITWQTAGSRRDVIQASPRVGGTYTNLSAPIAIPGTGIVTTNFVDVGAATNRPTRFYRVKYEP